MSFEPMQIVAILVVALMIAGIAAYAIKHKGRFHVKYKSGKEGREVELSAGGQQESDDSGAALGNIENVEVLGNARIEGSDVNIQVGHSAGAPKKDGE